jgi:hypothetical protein
MLRDAELKTTYAGPPMQKSNIRKLDQMQKREIKKSPNPSAPPLNPKKNK